jgi:hypothetical protein
MKTFTRISAQYMLLLCCFLKAADVSASDKYAVRILSQNSDSYTMEFTIDDFVISQDQNGHSLVTIVGMPFNHEPGKPRLPIKGVLLSVPAYSQFDLVILEEENELKTGIHILPNPNPIFRYENDDVPEQTTELKEDMTIYRLDDFYPIKPVALKILGFMRDRYLLQVSISPVQYNPVKSLLKLNKKIRFQIKQKQQRLAPASPQNVYTRDESSTIFNGILNPLILNSKQVNPDFLPFKFHEDTEGRFDAAKFYRRIAADNPVKIGVFQDEFYRVSFQALRDAGWDWSLANPQNIHLFNRGREIPIHVIGEEDGKIDPNDAIIFYGQANQTMFTNQNIYWLTVDDKPGLRMQMKDGQPTNSGTRLRKYRKAGHFEDNKLYKHEMPFRQGQDHWVWDEIKPGEAKEFKFNLSHLDTSGLNAAFRVLLYARENRQYVFRFFLNGHEIADTTWDHGGNFFIRKVFPQSFLAEGENVLAIQSFGTDGAVDFDWFEIEYWKMLTASKGKIDFAPPQNKDFEFEIDGFVSNQIDVYEIRDTVTVDRLLNMRTIPTGTGYALNFRSASDSTTSFVCLESNQYLSPSYIASDEPSNLQTLNKQSDCIIITHDSFYNNILGLAKLHRGEGLSVEVVKVQDIYDEFNYGIFHPQALRDFLQYAYYFWKSPAYVLLVGDATYDYKDYLGLNLPGHVPTHLFENYYASYQTSNDSWFVCVSGKDVLPDMMIGRLPVRNAAELDNILHKIFDYNQDYLPASWKRTVLMVADDSRLAKISSKQARGWFHFFRHLFRSRGRMCVTFQAEHNAEKKFKSGSMRDA